MEDAVEDAVEDTVDDAGGRETINCVQTRHSSREPSRVGPRTRWMVLLPCTSLPPEDKGYVGMVDRWGTSEQEGRRFQDSEGAGTAGIHPSACCTWSSPKSPDFVWEPTT